LIIVGGKITLLRAAANFAMQLLASVLATLLLGAVFDSVVLSDGTSMSVAQQLLVIIHYKDLHKVFITEFLFIKAQLTTTLLI
jgi:glycerol uptake facilitator-like aquaporin